jgi:hypothetical protein
MNRIVFLRILSCVFLSTALSCSEFPAVAHRVGTWPRVDLYWGTLSLEA